MTQKDRHRWIEQPPPPQRARALSANQLVSYNMLRARRSEAWTQQEVADLLERFTGRSWSNASVSAAERAWQGGRPRRFDASEIVALSKIFDKPITYFFLPPDGDDAIKWAGMQEYPDNLAVVEPLSGHPHDLNSLITVNDLLHMIGNIDSVEFQDRLDKLGAVPKRHFMAARWGRQVELRRARGDSSPVEEGIAEPMELEKSDDVGEFGVPQEVVHAIVRTYAHDIAAAMIESVREQGYDIVREQDNEPETD